MVDVMRKFETRIGMTVRICRNLYDYDLNDDQDIAIITNKFST